MAEKSATGSTGSTGSNSGSMESTRTNSGSTGSTGPTGSKAGTTSTSTALTSTEPLSATNPRADGPEPRRIGVVGLGTMGAGIAEVLARAGLDVVGIERDEDCLRRARARLTHSLDRAVERGKIDRSTRDGVVGRIRTSTDLTDLADRDLVIEAISERLAAKRALLARLDGVCGPDTVFVTNTSSLSVTELAAATGRPSRVLGTHWFNPAPVMRLVEIVRTVMTDASALAAVGDLLNRVGKIAVIAEDRAGFIVNALLFGYLNNAVRMLEARYATREDIDAAMRLGCGHPMGPLALLDLIGLDDALAILDSMYHHTRDHRHAPAPLLGQLVAAGLLGRKTGRGFYTYAAVDSPEVVPAPAPVPGAPMPGAAETVTEPAGRRETGSSVRSVRSVRSVGVVGSGTMARGIVEALARSGQQVIVRARDEDRVAAVLGRLASSLASAVTKGRLSEAEREATLARVRGTTDLGELSGCDLLIEAVVEDLAVKRELFVDLDKVAPAGAVLATTTSSLPIIACARATRRPADVVGMHWFNPAAVMRLVEVVPTVLTAADVTATVAAVARAAGKHPVVCADRAGFIVNALLFPLLNDAVKMVEAHYATVEDIDTAMTVGCGHPMGPFALADVVGLDVTLAIIRALYQEFREPGYAPAPLLEHLVSAGYLGRKTGRGFHDHRAR